MPFVSFLQWCSSWGAIVFIRDSKYGMPFVQSFHLMGLTVLLATTVVVNLRLAGIGLDELPLVFLARQLKPWALGALGLVILSGCLIFLATPGKYLGSNPFRIKMTLLCLAIVFHFGVLSRFTRSEPESRGRLVNVIIACLSLSLWFAVGWSGRAIAFVP